MVLSKIATYLEMIKFQHSIFALPFAYLGAFLAEKRVPSLAALFWITVAMVGARSFAMAVNRIIDKEIDRRNPRTANRALPKGQLSVSGVLVFSLASLVVFLIAVFHLAPLCRYLWPFVVIPFVIYPYTKRFTWLSHFLLGACLGLAPVGAWVAITNTLAVEPLLLGAAVMCWVAGFDIFYAIQDVDFDRAHGLRSIPAAFGIRISLVFTKTLHFFVIVLLAWVGLRLDLGFIYFTGVFIAGVLLIYENSIVKADDVSRLNVAFFTMNGVISVVMFLFVAGEILFRGANSV